MYQKWLALIYSIISAKALRMNHHENRFHFAFLITGIGRAFES
jgi:hypothetical protein